ncbi:MAG: DUF488 domain-containing protein [Rhodothermaceae bacterium]
MKFYSIGVYNLTEENFFNKLTENNIDLFCDIRMRRAVRGSKYTFANSRKLQSKLQELKIDYLHLEGLAPTRNMLEIQFSEDKKLKIKQSERKELAEEYICNYQKEILEPFDLDLFFNQLKIRNVKNIVFFCVEENPAGCHRNLVLNAIKKRGFETIHL